MVGTLDVIMNSFNLLARSGQEIKLINVYKAVPLVFGATVVEVGKETIRIRTKEHQIVGLSRDKLTYIKSSLFPGVVQAKVVQMDLVNDEATLAEFELADTGIGDREMIRVEPGNYVEVMVEENSREVQVKGELLDISRGGLGLVLASRPANSHLFPDGSGLILYLVLPTPEGEAAHKLRIEGTVIYSRPDNLKGHRVGVKLFPDEQSKACLTEFVSQRQAQIADEIKALRQSLS